MSSTRDSSSAIGSTLRATRSCAPEEIGYWNVGDKVEVKDVSGTYVRGVIKYVRHDVTVCWGKKDDWPPDCEGHESAALCDLFQAVKGGSESNIPANKARLVLRLFAEHILEMYSSLPGHDNTNRQAQGSDTGTVPVPSPDKAAGVEARNEEGNAEIVRSTNTGRIGTVNNEGNNTADDIDADDDGEGDTDDESEDGSYLDDDAAYISEEDGLIEGDDDGSIEDDPDIEIDDQWDAFAEVETYPDVEGD